MINESHRHAEAGRVRSRGDDVSPRASLAPQRWQIRLLREQSARETILQDPPRRLSRTDCCAAAAMPPAAGASCPMPGGLGSRTIVASAGRLSAHERAAADNGCRPDRIRVLPGGSLARQFVSLPGPEPHRRDRALCSCGFISPMGFRTSRRSVGACGGVGHTEPDTRTNSSNRSDTWRLTGDGSATAREGDRIRPLPPNP